MRQLTFNHLNTVPPALGRFVLPVMLSGGVTLVCFLIMQTLIATIPAPQETANVRISVKSTSLDKENKLRERRPRIERMLPSSPPWIPDSEASVSFPALSPVVGRYSIDGSLAEAIDTEISGFSFASPATDLRPLRVVQPVYPFKAIIREIEGEVLIEFTVAENGKVLNPRVVSAQPERIFDKAAIRAVQGFLFRPPVLDNVAFRVRGMRLRFYFMFEDSLGSIAQSERKPARIVDLD